MIILAVLLTFLLIFTYYIFKKDIITPSFVYITGYTLSAWIAVFNIFNWNIDIGLETFVLILYAMISFLFVEFLFFAFYGRKSKKYYDRNKDIVYSKFSIKLLMGLVSVFTLFWLYYLFNVIASLGFSDNFGAGMAAYRHWSSYTTDAMADPYYNLLQNVKTFIHPALYVLTFIGIYRYKQKNTIIQDSILWIIVIIILFQMLSGGSRGGVVGYIITLFMLLILMDHKFNKKITINIKVIAKTVVYIGTLIFAFYFCKHLVGRSDTIEFTEYFSLYAGTQIPLLDMFIQFPPDSSNIIGKETFTFLNYQLIRWGIIDVDPYISHFEFRYTNNGIFMGNSYPSIRTYLYDFGYIGPIILCPLFSAIVNYMYYSILYCDKNITLRMLFYCMIFNTIFFDFARGFFFSGYFNLTTIKTIIIIWIYCMILIPEYRLSTFKKIMRYKF